MAKNPIQFQPGMGLMSFLEQYGSEQPCREALAKVRWLKGFRCQGCGHTGHCHLKGRDVYQCVQRYLSEFCYRFNRRFDLAALVPRLIVAAARTPPLTYRLATLDA